MNPSPKRQWIAAPAWWVPVWAVVDATSLSMDALEEAVVALVRAGVAEPREMTRHLPLALTLLESACEAACSAGHLQLDEAQRYWIPSNDDVPDSDEPSEQVRTLEAWVCWDPEVNRLLPQVWLGADTPEDSECVADGWEVVPMDEATRAHKPSAPRDNAVAAGVRWLAQTREAPLLQRVGSEVVAEESIGLLRALELRLTARFRRGALWVPVEHRATGPVVWRPSVAVTVHVRTEPDPRGHDGLLRRFPGLEHAALSHASSEARAEVEPWLLRELGHESLADLEAWARRNAARELGPVAEARPTLAAAVARALIEEATAEASNGDWRSVAGAWADVLEVLTRDVAHEALPELAGIQGTRKDLPERSKLKRDTALKHLLGPSWKPLFALFGKSRGVGELRAAVERDADTVGSRALMLAVVAATSETWRVRLMEAAARVPGGVFAALHRAKNQRNTVIHHRKRDDEVDPGAFRAGVLALCRGLGGV